LVVPRDFKALAERSIHFLFGILVDFHGFDEQEHLGLLSLCFIWHHDVCDRPNNIELKVVGLLNHMGVTLMHSLQRAQFEGRHQVLVLNQQINRNW